MKRTVIAGKKVIVAYFVPEGWYLDDFGDLEENEAPSPRGVGNEPVFTPKTEAQKAVADIQEITPEDIPF